jgi:hypothetical protein
LGRDLERCIIEDTGIRLVSPLVSLEAKPIAQRKLQLAQMKIATDAAWPPKFEVSGSGLEVDLLSLKSTF